MVSEAERSRVGLLDLTYRGLLRTAAAIGPDDLSRPTRAREWTVADLLFHMLLDAQRVLVTVATPTDKEPDRDDVSYWRDFPPGRPGSTDHAAFVRRSVLAYARPAALIDQFTTTLSAAARSVRSCDPTMRVRTQGHVLTLADFCSSVAVEAAVHHLDLIVDLPAEPGPDAAALAEARRVLTGLLGSPFPGSWSDREVVLRATGREPAADPRLPLIG